MFHATTQRRKGISVATIVAFVVLQISFMTTASAQFDVQGHRGCRGLLPENTIPGFIKAVELGVTTLELDVVITADNQVLVSHDPVMSHEICKTPEGDSITESGEKSLIIFQMKAAVAQQYNCGESGHKEFPGQRTMKLVKPLLNEVIDTVESYVAAHHLKPVRYNIETKCSPEGDGVLHPDPATFAESVMDVVRHKNIASRTMIQSFDIRTLQYLHQQKSPVQLVLLIENLKSVDHNISQLGFNPDVYSPYYKLVNKQDIKYLHSIGIKVIPWTVNTTKEMEKLIRVGVDGIITDYPDRLIEVLKGM